MTTDPKNSEYQPTKQEWWQRHAEHRGQDKAGLLSDATSRVLERTALYSVPAVFVLAAFSAASNSSIPREVFSVISVVVFIASLLYRDNNDSIGEDNQNVAVVEIGDRYLGVQTMKILLKARRIRNQFLANRSRIQYVAPALYFLGCGVAMLVIGWGANAFLWWGALPLVMAIPVVIRHKRATPQDLLKVVAADDFAYVLVLFMKQVSSRKLESVWESLTTRGWGASTRDPELWQKVEELRKELIGLGVHFSLPQTGKVDPRKITPTEQG